MKIKRIGTIIVNILVSALPKTLPPRYKNAKNNKNFNEKFIFFQLIVIGIIENNKKNMIRPLKGNLNNVPGFSSL